MNAAEYAREAERELESAASCYGISHGGVGRDAALAQITRAQYHATRAVALTNLALLAAGVPDTPSETT